CLEPRKSAERSEVGHVQLQASEDAVERVVAAHDDVDGGERELRPIEAGGAGGPHRGAGRGRGSGGRGARCRPHLPGACGRGGAGGWGGAGGGAGGGAREGKGGVGGGVFKRMEAGGAGWAGGGGRRRARRSLRGSEPAAPQRPGDDRAGGHLQEEGERGPRNT